MIKELTIGGTNLTLMNTSSERYFQFVVKSGQYNLHKFLKAAS